MRKPAEKKALDMYKGWKESQASLESIKNQLAMANHHLLNQQVSYLSPRLYIYILPSIYQWDHIYDSKSFLFVQKGNLMILQRMQGEAFTHALQCQHEYIQRSFPNQAQSINRPLSFSSVSTISSTSSDVRPLYLHMDEYIIIYISI